MIHGHWLHIIHSMRMPLLLATGNGQCELKVVLRGLFEVRISKYHCLWCDLKGCQRCHKIRLYFQPLLSKQEMMNSSLPYQLKLSGREPFHVNSSH